MIEEQVNLCLLIYHVNSLFSTLLDQTLYSTASLMRTYSKWVYQGNAPDESALRWSFIKTYSSFGGAGIPILGCIDPSLCSK